MALTRRIFTARLVAAGLAGGSGFWRLARQTAPATVVQALRVWFFPGHVRALNPRLTRTPGRWTG